MNRKEYQKPTMQVVKLHHQSHILAGSVESTRKVYDETEEQEW